MSSSDSRNQSPVAAFVGIDWADQKHAIVLRAAASTASSEHRSIGTQPDALAEWVWEVRERLAGQGRILVCLEQSRGALIHFLMGYECFELYPINPKQLASYREAFGPVGPKTIRSMPSYFAACLVFIMPSYAPGILTTC